MMVLGSMSALAAEKVTITITDSTKIGESTEHVDDHTYTVYQVYTGDVEGDLLKNVKYGSDYTSKTVGDAVPRDELDAITDARAFATQWLAGTHGAGTAATYNSETKKFTIEVDPGYYIIVDSASNLVDGDSLSANIVRIVGDTAVTPKKDTVSDNKEMVSDGLGKVTDHDPTDPDNKVNDVSIGDVVNYKITAKVPAEAQYYNYYYFVINDTLDAGLTLVENSIAVKAGDNDLATPADYAIEKGAYTAPVTPNLIGRTGKTTDDKTFKIGLVDAKAHAGETITVTYQAILNEDAKVGEESNDNTSTVTYSNQPEHNYDGKNHPSFPDTVDSSALGETPKTVTKTHTTGIKITKVDQDNKPLTGAGFTLTGDSVEKTVVKTEEFTKYTTGDQTDYNYYKLADGTYTTTAPVTAKFMQYKEVGVATSTGYVEDASYTGTDKVVAEEVTYRPFAPATDIGKKVYTLHENNNFLYDSTTDKYKKETKTEVIDKSADYSVTHMVDGTGVVEFVGLGEGTFTISESTVPAGYNAIEDITLKINFKYNPGTGELHWSKDTSDTSEATYNSTTGMFEITIKNQKGAQLPSTGGVGTTIFYVAGSIMVLAAAILLITKRRMGAND